MNELSSTIVYSACLASIFIFQIYECIHIISKCWCICLLKITCLWVNTILNVSLRKSVNATCILIVLINYMFVNQQLNYMYLNVFLITWVNDICLLSVLINYTSLGALSRAGGINRSLDHTLYTVAISQVGNISPVF